MEDKTKNIIIGVVVAVVVIGIILGVYFGMSGGGGCKDADCEGDSICCDGSCAAYCCGGDIPSDTPCPDSSCSDTHGCGPDSSCSDKQSCGDSSCSDKHSCGPDSSCSDYSGCGSDASFCDSSCSDYNTCGGSSPDSSGPDSSGADSSCSNWGMCSQDVSGSCLTNQCIDEKGAPCVVGTDPYGECKCSWDKRGCSLNKNYACAACNSTCRACVPSCEEIITSDDTQCQNYAQMCCGEEDCPSGAPCTCDSPADLMVCDDNPTKECDDDSDCDGACGISITQWGYGCVSSGLSTETPCQRDNMTVPMSTTKYPDCCDGFSGVSSC